MNVLATFAVGFVCGAVALAVGLVMRRAESRAPLRPRRHRCRRTHVITTFPDREIRA